MVSNFFAAILVLFCAFTLSAAVLGQDHCLTDADAKKVIASIDSPTVPTDAKKLRKEILDMREEKLKLTSKISFDINKNSDLIPQSVEMGKQQLSRVCQILKDNGWLTKDALKDDGLDAMMGLILDNEAYNFQRELLPVLVEAVKKGYISKRLLPSMVDSIRVGSGLLQIFGTQAIVKNDAVYLYPILDDKQVDNWRREYDLAPLDTQIANMESRYFLPVVKIPRRSPPSDKKQKSSDTSLLGISDPDNDLVKVETNVVNLNVRVQSQSPGTASTLSLSKDDFEVYENGVEQDISYFATTDKAFDLVLLLDFSGSTTEKRGLIKKAAQRFVASARPDDRIAVVGFADQIQIIADLTTNKSELNQKINDIDLTGASPIWESLKFTYEKILKLESTGRRSAVVFMTDGEDNSKNTTFADLMEIVRHNDTSIFSVWLNTGFGSGKDEWGRKFRMRVRSPMAMLADETGGEIYDVNNLKDLNGVYDQVINDLGRVYSIGYEPKNELHDGGWRDISVKVKNQPTLVARTRRGYYAN